MPPAVRRAIPAVVAAALLLVAGALAWPYTVDDAYIVARYASRWAGGLGYTMNDGPPTDGVTGPALTALLALGVRLGRDPIDFAKAVGAASMAIAAALVVFRIRGQAAGRYPAAWAVLALAAQTTLAVWCVAGLETGLATLLATAVALETTRRGSPRGAVVGLALGGLAWLRPDLAVFGAVQLGATFVASRREGAVALSLAALGASSVVAFRLSQFGDPLPLSFFAKGGDLEHGARYVLGGVLLCTGVGGLILAGAGASRGGPRFRSLALSILAHAAAVFAASGDWMPGYRLLAPILPAYVLLAAQGIRYAQVRGASPRGPATASTVPRPRVVLLFAALAVAVPSTDLAVQIPLARRTAATRAREGEGVTAALVRSCERVATVDVGYLAYRSRLEVVDLGGLTEPAIARLPGGHLDKRIAPAFLAARAPDCFLLHSSVAPRVDAGGRLRLYAGFPVEERLVRDPWLWSRYRVESVMRYAPGYYYVLLTRPPAMSAASR